MDQIKGVFSAIDKKIAEKAREAAQQRISEEMGVAPQLTPEQRRQQALSRMAPTARQPATPQSGSLAQQQASAAARRNTSGSSSSSGPVPSTPPPSGRGSFTAGPAVAAAATPGAAATPEVSPQAAVYNDLQNELADIYGGLAAAASHSVTTPVSPTFLSPHAPPPGAGHGLDVGLLIETLRSEILARWAGRVARTHSWADSARFLQLVCRSGEAALPAEPGEDVLW